METNNGWIEITRETMPKPGEEVLWLYEYGEVPFPGEYFCYDGRYVRIKMRHWYIEESLMEFTHWRPLLELPNHPSYQPGIVAAPPASEEL